MKPRGYSFSLVHPDQINSYKKSHLDVGLCIMCAKKVSPENKRLCSFHRQKRNEYIKQWRSKKKPEKKG